MAGGDSASLYSFFYVELSPVMLSPRDSDSGRLSGDYSAARRPEQAKKQGLRTLVHAYKEAVRAATLADAPRLSTRHWQQTTTRN